MKILVAVDGSAHTAAMLRLLKAMCWPKGSRFLVLSAVPVNVVDFARVPSAGSAAARQVQKETERAHQAIAEDAENELRLAGFNVASVARRSALRDRHGGRVVRYRPRGHRLARANRPVEIAARERDGLRRRPGEVQRPGRQVPAGPASRLCGPMTSRIACSSSSTV